MQHIDADSSMEILLRNDLWTTVYLTLDRRNENSAIIASFLATLEKWPAKHSSFIVKTLAVLKWDALTDNIAELVMQRMADYIPSLKTMYQYRVFANIALKEAGRYVCFQKLTPKILFEEKKLVFYDNL